MMKRGYFLSFCLLIISAKSVFSQNKDTIPNYQISEIEVTAQRIPSSIRSLNPLQILTGADIERSGIQSISDAVKRFSGVTVKDYGGVGGLKTVSIRGMGAEHTAVNYDGVAVSDVQSGQIDIGRFSLDNLAYLSLMIGQSDNIFQPARTFNSAGILTIKTLQPDFTFKSYDVSAQMKIGSFGLFNPSIYYAQKLNKRFSISLNTNWQSANNEYSYKLDNGLHSTSGRRYNSDANIVRSELNLYGKIGKEGLLKWKTNYYYSYRGLPGSVVLYNNYSQERVLNNDVFSQIHYETPLSEKLKIQSFLKFTRNYYKYLDISNKYDNGRIENRVTQLEYYGSIGFLYTFTNQLSLSASQDYFQNRLKNTSLTDIVDPYRNTSLTSLSFQYKTSKLAINVGGLATYIKEHAQLGKVPDDKKKLSPAISISYTPIQKANVMLRGSFKNSFRAPTFADLYYVRMANTNLLPEDATQYNLGVTWYHHFSSLFDYFSISVDGYHNDVKNKIAPFSITPDLSTMRNLGKVRMDGVDVNSKLILNMGNGLIINLSLNYSHQKVIDVTDPASKQYKNQIMYTPKDYGSASIGFSNHWFEASYSVIASGKRYFLDQNLPENELKPYTDHSISINKSFKKGDHTIRLQLDGLNLTNKNYQIISYYPMPGRSFVFSVRYQY